MKAALISLIFEAQRQKTRRLLVFFAVIDIGGCGFSARQCQMRSRSATVQSEI